MATWKVVTREVDGEKRRGLILPNVDQTAFDFPPTAAYGSETTKDDSGRVLEVVIPEDRFVPFAKPGGRLETKALRMIKAHTPDGRLVQIPMEDQINNHIASPENGIGLQPYIRKGFLVYWDPQTGKTAFCQTWGCWAEAKYTKELNGFCSLQHNAITEPKVERGGFSMGATTSTRWAGGV